MSFRRLAAGACNANYYMLKEFAKVEGLQVDVVTSSAKNRFEIEEFSDNIRIYKLDVGKKDVHFWRQGEIMKWLIKAYSLSRKLKKDNSYDYCHCWFGFPCGLVGMMLGIPYLVALRGSDVPWKKVAGMRDKLIHAYFEINLERVWSVVKDDLPELKTDISAIMKEIENSK